MAESMNSSSVTRRYPPGIRHICDETTLNMPSSTAASTPAHRERCLLRRSTSIIVGCLCISESIQRSFAFSRAPANRGGFAPRRPTKGWNLEQRRCAVALAASSAEPPQGVRTNSVAAKATASASMPSRPRRKKRSKEMPVEREPQQPRLDVVKSKRKSRKSPVKERHGSLYKLYGRGGIQLSNKRLTSEEERSLGRRIQRYIQVQQKLTQAIELKKLQIEEQRLLGDVGYYDDSGANEPYDEWSLQEEENSILMQRRDEFMYEDDMDEELDGMTIMSNIDRGEKSIRKFDRRNAGYMALEPIPDDENMDDMDGIPEYLSVEDLEEYRQNQHEESLDSSASPSLVDGDHLLTDDDIRKQIGLEGGRRELYKVLTEGAVARNTLMRYNIRLVTSIAISWFRRSNTMGFDETWTRPSLDEVIQEGILGLTTAAERFDPERKIKFSTYATNWITNSVRRSFQSSLTGPLRVPLNYQTVRQKYEKIVNQHHDAVGTSKTFEDVAEEMDMKPERLRFILSNTATLVALDAPLNQISMGPGIGTRAGASPGSDDTISLGEILVSDDPLPEELVERSLLRQCLENAMAAVLVPHERDVLRLRLGLDDGIIRTNKEIVEMFGGALSVTDIRSTELKAVKKLRNPYSPYYAALCGYLSFAGIGKGEIASPIV